jgi:hypothetical protein
MQASDRELLELAAKAAGVPAYWSVDGTLQNRPMFVVQAGGGMGTMPYEAAWNPLRDDGLALRLAVKLNLRVMPQEKCVYVESNPDSVLGFASVSEMEMNGDDPCAATRRAIVRAAAEIGRSME